MKEYTLIATPQLATTWVLRPYYLLQSEGAATKPEEIPTKIIIDSNDFKAKRDAAFSRQRTLLDTYVYQCLEYFCYAKLVQLLDYRKILKPDKLREIDQKAREISSKLGWLQIEETAHHGWPWWRKVGVTDREGFLPDPGADWDFQMTKTITDNELRSIERGNWPTDPSLIPPRYLRKLLAGLAVAKEVGGPAKIFDTPEYSPAAQLLVKNSVVTPEQIAVAENLSRLERAEEILMERAGKIGIVVKPPLLKADAALFFQSVKELAEMLDGHPEDEVQEEVDIQVAKARRKVKRGNIPGVLSMLITDLQT